MNDKKTLMDKEAGQDQDARAPQRKILGVILAAVLCPLLALVVWVGVMNTQDTDYIPVRVVGPEGYTCELSVDGVEVEGKVYALRDLDEIVITVSASDAQYVTVALGGAASVNEAFLRLPDGVSTIRDWTAVLNVRAQ